MDNKDVRLKFSSPWMTYVNKLRELFCSDPDIKFEYDNNLPAVTFYVNNSEKYEALDAILPHGKDFGNVFLKINIIPANGRANDLPCKISNEDLFNMAFDGNPVYKYSKTITGIFSNTITYVIFKHCVVQFFNDNLNDIYGNITTLYEDIAREIFADRVEGVCYCTDVEKGTVTPNWP